MATSPNSLSAIRAVILAGGRGSRLQEETESRPKPMVEIGGYPILWHIMKGLSSQGICEFVICLGYRGYQIKEYFANYVLHASDITVDVRSNQIAFHGNNTEPWRVTLVDTGPTTATGGRIARARPYLQEGEPFLMTYGDGVADVDLGRLLHQHSVGGMAATMTVVTPPGRFGAVELDAGRVVRFVEKPPGDGGRVNGGYFVLTHRVFDFIDGDDTGWEQKPLQRLAATGDLGAYVHDGFWLPMDTIRDRDVLEDLWSTGRAPWKTW